MRAAIAAIAAAALAGCSTTPQERIVVRTETVQVPIPVGCVTNLVPRPHFAVDALPLGTGVDVQMRALRAERIQRKGYEKELEAEIARCAGGRDVD